MSSRRDEDRPERQRVGTAAPGTTAALVAGVGLLILILTGAGGDAHAVAMAVGQSLLIAGAVGVVLHAGRDRD